MSYPALKRQQYRTERARFLRGRQLAVEMLERRELLALLPLTLADASFEGVSAAGISGNSSSFSSDDQLIAFESDAGNLTSNDFNGSRDIFVRDAGSATTILVSATPSGTSGNKDSYNPLLSADGRYVLFESDASDLVAGDNNNARDVFRRDLQTGATILASSSVSGAAANSGSSAQAISSDGKRALFVSAATNLVGVSIAGQQQLFVRDIVAGTTTLVSANFNDTAGGNGPSTGIKPAVFSPNGRFVAYESTATDIVSNDLNGVRPDIFLRDLEQSTTTIVSMNFQGTGTGDHFSEYPIFDSTGQKIAFISKSADLTADPPLGFPNFRVFVRNLTTSTTTLVSKDHTFDAETPQLSHNPVFSPDGRYIGYEGIITDNLTAVYARDLTTNTTILVSANTTPGGHLADGQSATPAFSPDSQRVYFTSTATNLVAGVAAGISQIYSRNLTSSSTALVSAQTNGGAGNGASTLPVLSPNGSRLAFQSQSSGLVAADNNALQDLFFADSETGVISLASPRSSALQPEYTSRTLTTDTRQPTGISSDGRYVVFTSNAQDLVANKVAGKNAYRTDRQTGVTQLVSVNADGLTGGKPGVDVSGNVALSADGRYVVFASGLGPDLVPGLQFESGSTRGIYVRDMASGTTKAINLNVAGKIAGLTAEPYTISPNGRYVAFATNLQLLPADTNNASDVYVYDLQQNTLLLASATAAGQAGNALSTILSSTATGEGRDIFSTDGRYLLFTSNATDLVAGGGANAALYRRDLQSGVTALVSMKATGEAATTFGHSLSADGSRVVFVTNTSLVTQDTNNQSDIYLRDFSAGTTTWVSADQSFGGVQPSISRDGQKVLYTSQLPMALIQRDLSAQVTRQISSESDFYYLGSQSDDGRYVAFVTTKTSQGGTSATSNLEFYDTQTQVTTQASLNQAGTAAGNKGVLYVTPRINAGGSVVAFASDSSDLIDSDTNGRTDIFAFTRPLGGGSLSGQVFADTDGSGTRNPNESGLASWRVFLDTNNDGVRQPDETQVVTASNGKYTFTGLAAGSYRVVAESRINFVQTAPSSHWIDLTLTAGDTLGGLDFGYQQQFANLQVDSTFGPPTDIPGEPLVIEWSVSNQGAVAAAGSWQDGVYFSADDKLDATDILLGTVPHNGGLAVNDFYEASLTTTVPAVLPKKYYVLVESDRRGQVPQDDRANDVLSSGPITVDVPTLQVGVDRPGTLKGPGNRQFYQVTPPAEQSLEIWLNTIVTSGAAAVYVSRGTLPTPGAFDFRGELFGPAAKVLIPRTAPQSTYYILVEGQYGEAASAGFTLSARLVPLSIEAVSPAQGGNTGRVTVRISGTSLSPTTSAQLTQGPTIIKAVSIDYRDPSLLFATFDLTGASLGNYNVSILDGIASELQTDAFQVMAGTHLPLQIDLIAPANFRIGRQTPIVVEVQNTGNVDMEVPLLRLSSSGALIRLAGEVGPGTNNRQILATSADGPAGILRPAQTTRITLTFDASNEAGSGSVVPFTLEQPADLAESIDWDNLKDSSRPLLVSAAAWDIIWDRFTEAAGSTVQSYQSLLAQNATYLGQLGNQTTDTNRLANFTLLAANNGLLGSVLTADRDLNLEVPGLALDFRRANLQTISGRYRLGPLGYGWVHNWEVSASADTQGNVTINQADGARLFLKQLDGSYQAQPGDAAVPTLVNGIVRLREADGTLTVFQDDGKLDFIEDPNRNRITAAYNGAGQLATLTHTSGASLTFTYDTTSGRLMQVADSTGRMATYAYDTSATQLLSVTTAKGTQSFEYVPGNDPATQHSLALITETNGSHTFYDYDSLGRLSATEFDGGAERQTIEYGHFGQITFKDAQNAATLVFFNDVGQPEIVRDPLGRTATFDYDSNFRLSRSTTPDGVSSLFSFSRAGNLLSSKDPLGNRLNLTYEPLFQQLTEFQDTSARKTTYDIDANGNPRGAHYSDGTSEIFTYDSTGNLANSTSRNGDLLQYTYDSRGLPQTITAPGIGVQSFTYDAHGNLLTATDTNGTTIFKYDSADRVTRIDYPNGRFLSYTYDANGRMSSVNQNGFVIDYAYDAAGRLLRLTIANATLVEYEYDALGSISRKQLGNGTYTTYEYDSAGQLLHLVNHADDNEINSRFNYAYDDMGRVSTVTTLAGTTKYGYDLDGQLASVTLPGGRLIQYQYDASGNRVKVIDNGTETPYASNNLNQYTAAGATTFTYDANGNLHTRTDASGTTTYSFNAFSQLVSASGPGGTFTYEYDALGMRVAEIKNGQRQEFLFDPLAGSLVGSYDGGGNVINNYAYGLGLIGQFDGANDYYFDFDALGSTSGLTDETGAYVNRYSYLPFGETTVQSEAVANPFRYVGERGVLDRGNGLLDMRARHYDPTVGQFISDDPLSLAGGDSNLRRYVRNAPTNFIDPDGLKVYVGVKFLEGTCALHAEVFFSNGSSGFFGTKGSATLNGILAGQPGQFGTRFGEDGSQYRIVAEFEDEAAFSRAIDEQNSKSGNYSVNPLNGDSCLTFPIKTAIRYARNRAGDPANFSPLVTWKPLKNVGIPAVVASDPNDIVGPLGYGPQQFTAADHIFPYTIRFQNDPLKASAPAQEVFVTQQLDPNLDWTTFELGDVGFGALVISVPPGLKEYHTQVNYQNLDGSPLLVDFTGTLDLATGIVKWTFRSLDPESGRLPAGAFDGFLPVDDATGRGQGTIQYFVRPLAELATGDAIDASASIVFDLNAPILTNVFTNKIDAAPPTSSVLPLPPKVNNKFTVKWNGVDDPGGSGIATYDVYVSDNGSEFTLWQQAVSATLALFTDAVPLHTYRFYVVATDNAGHIENIPALTDAQTLIANAWHNAENPYDVKPDTQVVPEDVLVIINFINANPNRPRSLPAIRPNGFPFLDVDDSNSVEPADVISVINFLNARPNTEAEATDLVLISPPAITAVPAPSRAQIVPLDLLTLVALDVISKSRRRRN